MLASARPALTFLLFLVPFLVFLGKFYHESLQSMKVWSQPAPADESVVHEVSEVVLHEDKEEAPRIRQASMIFGDSESAIYERSLKTHIRHGKRWGFPTHVLRQDSVGGKQFGKLVFNKILYLQALAIREMIKPPQKRSEWIMWVDADSIILNEEIPWTAFLPPSDGFQHMHLVGAKDWNGFNCGVFLLRVNAWTVQMLTDVLALQSLRPDVGIGFNAEQDAMNWVFGQAGRSEHVLYQPRPWFNGYDTVSDETPTVQDGDVLVHFAGMGEEKLPAMGKWLDRLDGEEKHLLQVPMENTTYPDRIKDFWSRLRQAQEVVDMVDDHRQDGWTNFTNPASIERVQSAEKRLKQACWYEAYNDTLMLKRIEQVTKEVDLAEREKGVVEHAIAEAGGNASIEVGEHARPEAVGITNNDAKGNADVDSDKNANTQTGGDANRSEGQHEKQGNKSNIDSGTAGNDTTEQREGKEGNGQSSR